jgi:hypothetical protein
MLHACVKRFDVMGGRDNILCWEGEVNKALVKRARDQNKSRQARLTWNKIASRCSKRHFMSNF